MHEAHVNIAIRWFIGYGVHEKLPDHSSLTRIRQRRGADRFRKIFKRTVKACLQAKIATGEIVHVDASPIRANVSWERLIERHVVEVLDENNIEVEKQDRQSGKYKKVCVTDPDATMATNARNRHLEHCYKQHTAVDDKMGVTLDVEVTTGEKNEGEVIAPQVDEVKATTGVDIKTVTADAGYAYAKVYSALERRGIDALIPAKTEPIRSRVPLRRCRYDAKHDILRCPRKRVLRPPRPVKHGRFFYSKAKDCARCPLKGDCLSKGRVNKAVGEPDRRLYQRHRWRSEGFPCRGKDLAWTCPRCPARPHEHAHSRLSNRRSYQFEAAGSRSLCAFCALVGSIETDTDLHTRPTLGQCVQLTPSLQLHKTTRGAFLQRAHDAPLPSNL
jgi:IS5 family transposase